MDSEFCSINRSRSEGKERRLEDLGRPLTRVLTTGETTNFVLESIAVTDDPTLTTQKAKQTRSYNLKVKTNAQQKPKEN